MAEGGDENEQNPFSFKKFVRKSSRDSPNSMNDSTEEDQQISVDLLDGSCSTERRGDYLGVIVIRLFFFSRSRHESGDR